MEEFFDAWRLEQKQPRILSGATTRNVMYFVQSEQHIGEEIGWHMAQDLENFSAAEGWERYKELRTCAYLVKPSVFYPSVYKCSCLEGMKNRFFLQTLTDDDV